MKLLTLILLPFISLAQSVIIDCPTHNAVLEVHDTVRVGSLANKGNGFVATDNNGTLKWATTPNNTVSFIDTILTTPATLTNYTQPLDGTYRIGGYIFLSSMMVGEMLVHVTYTKVMGFASVADQIIPVIDGSDGIPVPSILTTGFMSNYKYSLTDIQIRAKGGYPVSVYTTCTGTSLSYFASITVEKLR